MGAYIGANERFGSGDRDQSAQTRARHKLQCCFGISLSRDRRIERQARSGKTAIWKMKSVARWTLKELWDRVRLSAMF